VSDRHERQGSHTSHHGPHKCSSICLHSRMRNTTSSTVLTTNHSGRGPSNTARIAPVIWSVSVRTRPHALYPAYLQLARPPLLKHPQNTTCKRYLFDWQFSDSTHCCACKYRPTLQITQHKQLCTAMQKGHHRHPARHHRILGMQQTAMLTCT
jgi:hypothetical protein